MSSGGYDPPDAPSGTGGCGRLSFVTTVVSVQAAALASLTPGNVCQLVLAGTAPELRIEVRMPDGSLLGAVVDRWAELVQCLQAGYDYDAEVVTASPPVRVRISSA